MGKLTVVLNPESQWEIGWPHSDEIAIAAFARFAPDVVWAFVTIDEVLPPARAAQDKHPDWPLAALIAELELLDGSTMLLLDWKND
jgi:hypothetical protein